MSPHYVSRTDSLMVGQDGYAVYYPNDGFLGSVYTNRTGPDQDRLSLIDEFPDAYVVRVLIERVSA